MNRQAAHRAAVDTATLAGVPAAIAELRELIQQRLPPRPPAPTERAWLTTAEAAQRAGVTLQCIRNWAKPRECGGLRLVSAWVASGGLTLTCWKHCSPSAGEAEQPAILRETLSASLLKRPNWTAQRNYAMGQQPTSRRWRGETRKRVATTLDWR